MKQQTYTASDIEVLEGLEPVRKRPGMYIAGTDTPAGLHQLVFEILDNSVDEAMNGHADSIEVTLHSDGSSVSVTDNGRGIPVDKHPRFNKSALELILTTLHAGGKFSDKNYMTSGGLHGVGSSVVNALSVEMIATVRRDGKEYQQSYARGVPTSTLKVTNKATKGTGTTIFFRPDPEIFRSIDFSSETIRDAMQIKAYLNPGLELVFKNEIASTREVFRYDAGLTAYLEELLKSRKGGVVGGEPFFIERSNGVAVSLAFAWTESTAENFYSYVNGIYTPEGGSHEAGAKSGIVKAIRNYIQVHDIPLKGIKLGAEDIREGLIGIVSIRMPGDTYQPQFQGQTKSKLNNPEIAPIVESAARMLEQLLNEKPSAAEIIVDRVLLAAKARAASRQASQSIRRKIGISHRLTLPGKLADCSSTKPDETELFIVEGDSAGGSTKQGRNRHYQAVLPLRGKVLNSIASNTKKVLENKELSNIVAALGCGVNTSFQIDKLRYGKVIILTDADADGMHIATLLLAFFFTQMRPLIEHGCLYIGKSPLYGIYPKGADARKAKSQDKQEKGKPEKARPEKKGKKSDSKHVFWAYSDEELDKVLKQEKLTSPRIVRYKGLGEMNPDTLWDTTLDPKLRTLLRVGIDDEALVEEALQGLMGTDPSTRYRLICENAESLDVDV